MKYPTPEGIRAQRKAVKNQTLRQIRQAPRRIRREKRNERLSKWWGRLKEALNYPVCIALHRKHHQCWDDWFEQGGTPLPGDRCWFCGMCGRHWQRINYHPFATHLADERGVLPEKYDRWWTAIKVAPKPPKEKEKCQTTKRRRPSIQSKTTRRARRSSTSRRPRSPRR